MDFTYIIFRKFIYPQFLNLFIPQIIAFFFFVPFEQHILILPQTL